jgi:predicted signal transduction protein with EAL and GGDEF domain
MAEALLRDVSRTYDILGSFVQVGAFAGIASAAPGTSCRASDLLRRADIALDHARSARAARPTWFDQGMEQALMERSELEQAIRIGIEHGHFVPYFEPQVDLASGQVTGFEVLARWQHPNRGMLGPELFIPVAEDIGLIGALSESVMAQALDVARDWDNALSLSVNISPSQLADPWLAQRIVRLLTTSNFPAERLVMEVTESSLSATSTWRRAWCSASRTRVSVWPSMTSERASPPCHTCVCSHWTSSRSIAASSPPFTSTGRAPPSSRP